MNNWKIIHKYKELCESGSAEWLRHSCGDELVVLIGKDDEPCFWCMYCDIHLTPGLFVYDQIKEIIRENEDV